MADLLLLTVGGLVAGAVGGLLGVGGGVVLMPLLRFGMGLSPAQAAGTCIVAVFFTTLGGSYRHYRLGHVELRSILPVMAAGAVATVVFSLLFQLLTKRQQWLDLAVGAVFCLISVRMVWEGVRPRFQAGEEESGDQPMAGRLLKKLGIGAAAGVLPGLLGIGTGVILVPAFAWVLGASIKMATGCSLACFCCNALISSAFKANQGFVVVSVAVPACVGTLVGSNVGAMLNKRFSSGTVRLLFGVLFGYVALRFILLFFESTT